MSKSTWLVHHPRSCVLYLFPASLPTPTRLVLLLAERDRLLLLLGDFTGEGLAFLVPHKDVLRRNAKQKRGERVADAMPATITIQAQARSLSLSLSLSLSYPHSLPYIFQRGGGFEGRTLLLGQRPRARLVRGGRLEALQKTHRRRRQGGGGGGKQASGDPRICNRIETQTHRQRLIEREMHPSLLSSPAPLALALVTRKLGPPPICAIAIDRRR